MAAEIAQQNDKDPESFGPAPQFREKVFRLAHPPPKAAIIVNSKRGLDSVGCLRNRGGYSKRTHKVDWLRVFFVFHHVMQNALPSSHVPHEGFKPCSLSPPDGIAHGAKILTAICRSRWLCHVEGKQRAMVRSSHFCKLRLGGRALATLHRLQLFLSRAARACGQADLVRCLLSGETRRLARPSQDGWIDRFLNAHVLAMAAAACCFRSFSLDGNEIPVKEFLCRNLIESAS